MARNYDQGVLFRWCVTFQLANGDWEWLTVEAKHPAGAKQKVEEKVGGRVKTWATPTLTEKDRTLVDMRANQIGGELVENLFGAIKDALAQ